MFTGPFSAKIRGRIRNKKLYSKSDFLQPFGVTYFQNFRPPGNSDPAPRSGVFLDRERGQRASECGKTYSAAANLVVFPGILSVFASFYSRLFPT